jgi:hypothetical protein
MVVIIFAGDKPFGLVGIQYRNTMEQCNNKQKGISLESCHHHHADFSVASVVSHISKLNKINSVTPAFGTDRTGVREVYIVLLKYLRLLNPELV